MNCLGLRHIFTMLGLDLCQSLIVLLLHLIELCFKLILSINIFQFGIRLYLPVYHITLTIQETHPCRILPVLFLVDFKLDSKIDSLASELLDRLFLLVSILARQIVPDLPLKVHFL